MLPPFKPAEVQAASRIAQEAFPSTVLLLADSRGGKHVSLGSGFFVSSNTIVTNYHVIRGATRIYAKMMGSNTLLPVERVVRADPKRDLALLVVRGVESPALRLGASSSLKIGQDIFVIGNPEGLEGTLSTGIISGFRQSAGNRYIQITAPISHGSSGGPVLNASGEVIGVAVASLNQGQNLNFAIPVDDVTALLSENDPRNRVKAASRKGLDVATCEQDFRAQPKSPESYTELGKCYYYAGCLNTHSLCQKAINAFKTAISLDPDYAPAYLGLADAYDNASDTSDDRHRIADLVAAVDALKVAIRLQPTASNYYALGSAYSTLALYDNANTQVLTGLSRQAFLDSINRAAPEDALYLEFSYGGLGVISQRRGDYDDAISNFGKAIRGSYPFTSRGQAFRSLVEVYKVTGKVEQGIADFKDIVTHFKQRLQQLHSSGDEPNPSAHRLKIYYAVYNLSWSSLSLGKMYVYAGDKASALEQYKVIKALSDDGGVQELAKQLLDIISPSRH